MIPLSPIGSHAIFVFVSAAFLLAAFVLEVKPFFEAARPKPAVLAARWLLLMGTVGLLGATITGFVHPGKSIMFNDISLPYTEHRFLGLWTSGVFGVLTVWRFMAGRRPSALISLVWLSAFWILGAQILGGIRLSF